jgi:hypothetical protein
MLQATMRVGSSNVKKKQVQLPDVTGLTVAVESPAKGQSHQPYEDTGKEYGDDEGRGMSPSCFFVPELNKLQPVCR